MSWAYGYDLRSQVRSVTGTIDGVPWGGSYQYRRDGNIDRQTIQGTETIFGYSGDRMTQRGQQDLGWDGNGQLTSDEVRTIGWTWDAQMRSATNAGGGVVCRYDPDGNRIRKEIQATGQPTQTRKYIVDAAGDVPVVLLEIDPAVTDPNQAITKTFLYIDTQLVGFHDGFYGDSLYFALSDQHGSVRQVVNDSGQVVSGYAYDPWGSPLASPAFEAVPVPIRYAGYWWDSEIQRYYCWARYYDPQLERFLSRDPESGSFNEPMELHRYLYCLNDPINRLDPDGAFSYGEITVGAGIRYGLAGLNAYGMFRSIRHYAQEFVAGASIRNIIVGATVEVAANLAAGKMLSFVATAAAPAINAAAKTISKHMHHVFPRFLGGASKGITRELGSDVHEELHRQLYHNLSAEFGDLAAEYKRPFNKFRANKEWAKLLEDPVRKMKAMQILVDTTGDIDMQYGTDLLQSLIEQLGKQWK